LFLPVFDHPKDGLLFPRGVLGMQDCKNCKMTFDQDEYEFCPYCGQEPGEGMEAAGDEVREDTSPVKDKKVSGKDYSKAALSAEPEKEKSAGGKLKYILIGAAVLAVAAVAVFGTLSFGDSAVTVPDKHPTIQAAIDAAVDGDEIVVQAGVYRENIDFKGKNITLRSTDPDDPAVVSETIIDGGGGGTVVSFRSGEGEGAVLSGFTVTRGSGILISGGSSPVIEKCIIEDNTAEFGAGIAIFDSSPTIIGNQIIANSGFLGGGLFIEESSPLVEGNIIGGNRAEMGSGIVIISGSAPTVINNVIADNVAARLGGGIVVAVGSSPTISGNTITGNSAERNGGGLLIEESDPVIEDNTINRNRAANGGGIFIVNSLNGDLLITGNTITNNLAFIAGGGLYMEGSSPVIEDNSFSDNISEHLGGGVAVYNSSPVFRRNTFSSNEAKELGGGGAIWASIDSVLLLSDPDDNNYLNNSPNDLVRE
jgi:parallel beta-helix repeat protein